jgi:hypothetical protein
VNEHERWPVTPAFIVQAYAVGLDLGHAIPSRTQVIAA